MNKIKKKQPIKRKNISYDFSKPHDYFLSKFGLSKEEIDIYIVNNINVSSLLEDFKIFENLHNVQNWSISTLIQRELDHKRSNMICKDYLLGDSESKYFPPLVAVLIPTDNNYNPSDKYKSIEQDELNNIKTKFMKGDGEYNNYEDPKGIAGGISIIPFYDEQGKIVWDKRAVSAVIIDGQHRYKALEKAVEDEKDFSECQVTVTIVDLTKICTNTKRKPTEIARDLFVTINNTPIEVDETRLILMDDKDALATFTQVLIDDSDLKNDPAIPPELIDWKCDGGKNDISCSLSGVLVLRQIILNALFEDSKISVIEDRTDKRKVKKWIEKINLWISPDSEILKQTDNNIKETLIEKYNSAIENSQEADEDDDDEDSIFLFSYNVSVSKIIKNKFKKLFLSTFREVFTNLMPYSKCKSLAIRNQVLTKGTPLSLYYRSFEGKRKELFAGNPELKKNIKDYENEFKKITKDIILFTVMGQKAIFKSLFDGFLSTAEEKTNENYISLAKEFIINFNEVYHKLCPSDNIDEHFFSTNYQIGNKLIEEAKILSKIFWKGIIIKFNGEIDYGNPAIKILSSIISDLIFYIRNKKDEFKFSKYNDLKNKHIAFIKKMEIGEDKSDEEIKNIAERVLNFKQEKLNELLMK